MAHRVVFMGTPDFAVPSLSALIEADDFDVLAVVTQPDRRAGRGRKVSPPPVKVCAEAAQIPVLQPEKLRTREAWEAISAYAPDFLVVAAYGQILGPRYLELARVAPINVHASVLPRYRGAAPIHWSIVRGEKKTGVSIMKMGAELDAGPVYATRETPIEPDDTAGSLHDRLAVIGAQALVDALPMIASGMLEPADQDEHAVTWAPMLDKADGALSFDEHAQAVTDRARGMSPWPGAFCRFRGQKIKLMDARVVDCITSRPPGHLLGLSDQGVLQIACAVGCMGVSEVQLEGRKRQSASDFVNGYDPKWRTDADAFDADPLLAERRS